MLEPQTSAVHFDKGEISKLPPFNDFIRKNVIESVDDIVCKDIDTGVWQSACRYRKRDLTAEELQAAAKNIAMKKKKEIAESKEVKDKKVTGKDAAAAIRGEIAEDYRDLKSALVENKKILLMEGMKEVSQGPDYHPWVG